MIELAKTLCRMTDQLPQKLPKLAAFLNDSETDDCMTGRFGSILTEVRIPTSEMSTPVLESNFVAPAPDTRWDEWWAMPDG